MVLVDGTLATRAAAVGQVAPDRALEEGLATLAGELAIVLARRLVAANNALDALLRLARLALALLLLVVIVLVALGNSHWLSLGLESAEVLVHGLQLVVDLIVVWIDGCTSGAAACGARSV